MSEQRDEGTEREDEEVGGGQQGPGQGTPPLDDDQEQGGTGHAEPADDVGATRGPAA